MKFNKIESDYINDRAPVVDRVRAEPPSDDIIGLQRPRNPLKLDVSKERMDPVMVAGLETNPYVIPLHAASKKIAAKEISYGQNQSARFS
jgi:hypothetical protein